MVVRVDAATQRSSIVSSYTLRRTYTVTTLDRLDPGGAPLVSREDTPARTDRDKVTAAQRSLPSQQDGRDETTGRHQPDRQLHDGNNGDLAALKHPGPSCGTSWTHNLPGKPHIRLR